MTAAIRADAPATRDFATVLRQWRAERGLSQGRLAQHMPHSEATIAKVESGARWPTLDLAQRCDEVLQTGGALTGMWPAVLAEQQACDGRRQRRRFDGSPAAVTAAQDARALLTLLLADADASVTHPYVREALAALGDADN